MHVIKLLSSRYKTSINGTTEKDQRIEVLASTLAVRWDEYLYPVSRQNSDKNVTSRRKTIYVK